VAETVVYELEVIQVEEEHCYGLLAVLRTGEGVFETVHEQEPVRQIGQGIVQGLMSQLLLQGLALGDVLHRSYHPDRPAGKLSQVPADQAKLAIEEG
jgi:hypothetical protein